MSHNDQDRQTAPAADIAEPTLDRTETQKARTGGQQHNVYWMSYSRSAKKPVAVRLPRGGGNRAQRRNANMTQPTFKA